MVLRRGLRNWLLAKDADPSVRLRVLRDLLDRPADDPAVVRDQKKDGGWHCFRSRTGTLDCWEALAAFVAIPSEARTPPIRQSIERGAEFYLERRLFREGPAPYRPWFRLHYPVHYYYDLLVGLDTLTSLGYGEDPRMRPALDRLEAMRNRDGSWNMDALHPDTEDPAYQFRGPFYPLGLEVPGRPSRCSRAPRGLRFGPADSLRERGNPHRSRPSALLISGPAGRG